ncbi:MAG: arylsulfatase [Lentisphaerales bacterium]|nr:arylsulfatase [Lentisphaerales bacterium]
MFTKSLLSLLLLTLACLAEQRPNIIIIMTDDMGYSDIGSYGSEIKTPNLDHLAYNGLRFTQFYNAGRCCPTRASLLTGLYPHQAGMGGMTNDSGPKRPAFRGRIMERAVTLAEVLSPTGYHTIQTGKWHVGSKKKEWWPLGRGFDRTFGSPQGGGFYFRPADFKLHRQIVRNEDVLFDREIHPPKDFYTTDAYTDEGLNFVHEAVSQKKPFMWYLAYNAPHFPLQAKEKDIAKYRGQYKKGWDVIRENRLQKLIDLGLLKENTKLSPKNPMLPSWDSLSEEQKDTQDFYMATYAAMIDSVDQNIGKIVKKLKSLKVYENTLIIFLCDNGATSEGGKLGSNRGPGKVGQGNSFAYYGEAWANVSNTPFRFYKKFAHEGGIATPFIAHWPKGIRTNLKGALISEPCHVIDIMPTCLELAKATYPQTYKGNTIVPYQGLSLNSLFKGQNLNREKPLFFEHEGNKALRFGAWKLVSKKGSQWELYNMKKDRTELNDLSASSPEISTRLIQKYKAWWKSVTSRKSYE